MKETTIILLMGALIFTAATVYAADVIYEDHEITFLGMKQTNGKCAWSYLVCSGTSPAISNWVMGSCIQTPLQEIILVTSPEIEGGVEVGRDPHTNITGIKFETSMEDGQCANYTLIVNECSEGDVEVGLKAGRNVYRGQTIKGPTGECSATTATTTTTQPTTTTAPTTTTTIPKAAEFSSISALIAVLLTTPAFTYLIIRKKN